MIPSVDISRYTTGGDLNCDAVKQAVVQIHDVISEFGFCYLTGHGVSEDVLENVLRSSRSFFGLPVDIKRRYARPETGTNHGWVSLERERLNPDRPFADLKEAFNYQPGDKVPMPGEVPDMERDFSRVFSECRRLADRVLDLIGQALEIKDAGFLRNCHRLMGEKGNCTALRSLYYPASSEETKEGQLQCSEHSDYGSITLLFQDDTGGLQVPVDARVLYRDRNRASEGGFGGNGLKPFEYQYDKVLGKDGQYHDVPPLPGAVLVNIGDLMQRWTADKYPSTKHKVVVPKGAFLQGRARQSLALFVHPDDDTVITCLDGSSKYPPITSYDYLMQRFGVTY